MKLLLITLVVFVGLASAAQKYYGERTHITNPGAGRVKRQTSDFAQQQLDIHNNYRAIHGAPAMSLDAGLTADAQGFADYLATVHCQMEHCWSFDSATYTMVPKFNTVGCQSGMSYQGENLAYGWGSGTSSLNATKMWYEEAFYYDFCNHGFSATLPGHEGKAVGHFTQVVWRNSLKLGIGKATGCNGKTFVVGRYSPPGNYMGQFAAQVGDAPAYLAGNGCGGGNDGSSTGTDTGAGAPEEVVEATTMLPVVDPDARETECTRLGYVFMPEYKYPTRFGRPACDLVCYQSPYIWFLPQCWTQIPIDCEKPDGSYGMCDDNANCV